MQCDVNLVTRTHVRMGNVGKNSPKSLFIDSAFSKEEGVGEWIGKQEVVDYFVVHGKNKAD